jgi:hypothetical protein
MWRRDNSWLCQDSNSDPSVVQPVASRYTDYAIPAPLPSIDKANILAHCTVNQLRFQITEIKFTQDGDVYFHRRMFQITYTHFDSGPSLAMSEPMQCKSDFSILSDQLGTFFHFCRISFWDIYMLHTEMEVDGWMIVIFVSSCRIISRWLNTITTEVQNDYFISQSSKHIPEHFAFKCLYFLLFVQNKLSNKHFQVSFFS